MKLRVLKYACVDVQLPNCPAVLAGDYGTVREEPRPQSLAVNWRRGLLLSTYTACQQPWGRRLVRPHLCNS